MAEKVAFGYTLAPFSLSPIAQKKIKDLEHYRWCCLTKQGPVFLVVNREYLGKAMDGTLLIKCWGMSQLWECPKQSSLILSEQACCSVWKQMRAKLIPAVSDVNNLKGKIISKFYSQLFLLQKCRGSHSSEHLPPQWGFSPLKTVQVKKCRQDLPSVSCEEHGEKSSVVCTEGCISTQIMLGSRSDQPFSLMAKWRIIKQFCELTWG